jgi:hypothetical protein
LIMARSNGDPLWVVPMKIVPKSHPPGGEVQAAKAIAMNSRLPKQTVLPREKPSTSSSPWQH